jgi:hypothetical protein
MIVPNREAAQRKRKTQYTCTEKYIMTVQYRLLHALYKLCAEHLIRERDLTQSWEYSTGLPSLLGLSQKYHLQSCMREIRGSENFSGQKFIS